MSHREEALGKTQDTLERLCLSAGLGTPLGSPGIAGGSVWDPDRWFGPHGTEAGRRAGSWVRHVVFSQVSVRQSTAQFLISREDPQPQS
ncbi:hypothetical protein L3Q82_016219, partial [Scortum barcoo]